MPTGHSMGRADGVILDVDEAVAEFLGRTRREIAGMNYIDLTHPGDRERNLAQVRSLIPGERPARIRKRYLRPNGEVAWAEVSVSRLESGADEGRLCGTLWFETAAAPPQMLTLWRAALELSAMDRLRREVIGTDLFSDHGWLLLMHMYLAEAEGRLATRAALAQATRLANQLVDRWLTVLQLRGLVEACGGAGSDRQLTARGIEKLETVLLAYSRPTRDALERTVE